MRASGGGGTRCHGCQTSLFDELVDIDVGDGVEVVLSVRNAAKLTFCGDVVGAARLTGGEAVRRSFFAN